MDAKTHLHNKSSDFRVTGLAMQYVTVCEREAWFYLHGIDIDRDNPDIVKGNMIDESTYEGKTETIIIDGMIAPDIMDDGRVMEVKPSSTEHSAAEMQLLYYLWYLKEYKDDSREGVLLYPTEKKRETVILDDENEKRVVENINKLYELWASDTPPELEKKPICSSCAYQDFCWK